MDITIRSNHPEYHSYFEKVLSDGLNKIFRKHQYVQSVKVHLHTPNGANKHVALRTRIFGKELFVEAEHLSFKRAVDDAVKKLRIRVQKYKIRRFH